LSIGNYHSVYFLGIGGIGMSALARWFNHLGMKVAGYDRTETELTHKLESEGMDIHYIDDIKSIPGWVLDKNETLIVYTPAIPQDLSEKVYLESKGYILHKRSQVLGMLTRDKKTIAVAGTHGKTTTSSMIAHIMIEAQKNCVAFLGGIMQGYESNLLMSENADDQATVVVEADEFDRSFLTLHPDIAVITSTDADHLDIYHDHSALKQSFQLFADQLQEGGALVLQNKIASQFHIDKSVKSYGIEEGDCQARNIENIGNAFGFDFRGDEDISNLKLYVPGFHNVENATAAITSAILSGVDPEIIKKAIGSYKGVKRRFEYIIKSDDLVYIDDYAHHPVEIKALLESVRALYPGKKVTAIFQPHLYSRTRDFVNGFAESLDLADEVLLMPIYPARELPIDGIGSEIIYNRMSCPTRQIVGEEDLLSAVKKLSPEVLLTIGAGDIDRFPIKIKEALNG
jgi:UDP-N-acetylmuramate--alanine ligase